MGQTVYTVTDETDLQNAIKAIDLASQANASESAGVSYQINFASPELQIDEDASPYAINLNSKDSLAINGDTGILDGEGAYRGLFVYAGSVTINNLRFLGDAAAGGGWAGRGRRRGLGRRAVCSDGR